MARLRVGGGHFRCGVMTMSGFLRRLSSLLRVSPQTAPSATAVKAGGVIPREISAMFVDSAGEIPGASQAPIGWRKSEDIVRLFYREALGREPEPSAIRGWVERLDAGEDLQRGLQEIRSSPEGQARELSLCQAPASRTRDSRIESEYRDWLHDYDFRPERHEASILTRIAGMPVRPLLSVLLACRTDIEQTPDRAMAALGNQLYPDWELLVSLTAETPPLMSEFCRQQARRDSRIKTLIAGSSSDPADAGNMAMAQARSDFVLLLGPDDLLCPHALWLIAETIASEPLVDLLCFDTDTMGADGRRSRPRFKTEWDVDRFLTDANFARGWVFRSRLARDVGGFRPEAGESLQFDLLLRIAEQARRAGIRHLPYLLASRLDAPPMPRLAASSIRHVLQDHFRRRGGDEVHVEMEPDGAPRIIRPLSVQRPLVSLIVVTRGSSGGLRRCVESVCSISDYAELEVLVIDNDSVEPAARADLQRIAREPRVRVLSHEGVFDLPAIVNRAAGVARGSILGLLGDDLQAASPGWLAEIVGQVMRPEVGAVGGLVVEPDGRIRHAGFVLGLPDVAYSPHRLIDSAQAATIDELRVVRSVSALSRSCLFTRRSVFDAVGGMDEGLAEAFADIDYCLACAAEGYRILWTPYAKFVGGVSPALPMEETPLQVHSREGAAVLMRLRWGGVLGRDPYLNPNSAHAGGVTALAEPPRVGRPWEEDPAWPPPARRRSGWCGA
jgi:GT2 family glycosyltransferase